MNNQTQFARPFPPGVCAIGRPAISSLGRAATLNHSERQRSSGTALGLRWGMYRTTCAVGTTGRRFAGLGCHRRGFELSAARGYDLLTGRGLVGSGLFSSALSHIDGIGGRANVPDATIFNAADDRLDNLVKPLPAHSSVSNRYGTHHSERLTDEIHADLGDLLAEADRLAAKVKAAKEALK